MTDQKFIGQGLDQAAFDEKAVRFIRKDWLDREVPLFSTKWFDYRRMHPTEATYLYADHLIQAYRNAYRRNIDSRRGEHVRPFPKLDLFDNPKATISAVWRGRQCADAIGMPYDLYLSQAYQFATRYWQQKHLPRPSQLYNDTRVVDPMVEYWNERKKAVLHFATSEHYKNDAYVGTAAQNAHHEWLMEHASVNGGSPNLVGRFVFKEAVLPESKAVARFGSEVVERARAMFS